MDYSTRGFEFKVLSADIGILWYIDTLADDYEHVPQYFNKARLGRS